MSRSKGFYGLCSYCGKPLKSRQMKYCSKVCTGKANAKPRKTHICENLTCGKEFEMYSNIQKFCCKECSKVTRKEKVEKDLDREYTHETRYLILLWTKQGWSKPDIARILGRSLKSVEKAFN